MKPQVFIGSSSEGLPIAYSLQTNLEDAADVTVWTQDVFRPTEYILESLLKRLHLSDLGIFVFTPDDLVRMRGVEHTAARDNVIFEFGLFVGQLGRENSIIIAPKGESPRLPSDLLGVNVLKYQSGRDDSNLDASLGPASNKIRRILLDIQPRANSIPQELRMSMIERRDLLTQQQREILSEIEAREQWSKQDLARRFPQISMSELNYRLEQLRLLMFISSREDVDNSMTLYSLSEPYRYAFRNKIRNFRTE